jgi:hypothetical protein
VTALPLGGVPQLRGVAKLRWHACAPHDIRLRVRERCCRQEGAFLTICSKRSIASFYQKTFAAVDLNDWL